MCDVWHRLACGTCEEHETIPAPYTRTRIPTRTRTRTRTRTHACAFARPARAVGCMQKKGTPHDALVRRRPPSSKSSPSHIGGRRRQILADLRLALHEPRRCPVDPDVPTPRQAPACPSIRKPCSRADRSAQSDKAHKHNSSLALAVRIILSTRRERERDVLSSTKAPWAVRVVRFISDYAHRQFHRAELTPAVPRCSNLGWCVSHTVEVTVGLRPAVVKRSWEKDGKFDSSRRDRGWAVGGARGRARGTCR